MILYSLQNLLYNLLTPSRHLPNTFLTPSWHFSDTFQTPSEHPQDTLCTPTRHQPNFNFPGYIEHCFQVRHRVGGWWVVGGGPTYIIMPLRGPTCKWGLARIQAKLNSQVWPECGKNNKKLELNCAKLNFTVANDHSHCPITIIRFKIKLVNWL